MSKLIYAPSLAAFKLAYPDWNQNTSDVYRSVGFTDDGYLYTHGKLFQMSVEGSDNPWGLAVSLTGQSLGVTVAGYTATTTIPVIDVKTTTDDDLSISKAAGVYTAIHKEKFAAVQNVGPTANANTTIVVPKITVSKTGHVTAATQYTATLNHVLQNLDTTTTTAYLLFGNSATTTTGSTRFNTTIKANLATGALYATALYEGSTAISTKYAPTGHASAETKYGLGNGTLYGHVKLSDSISSSSSVSGGTASTPKAVLDALNAAKAYAKDLLGTTDAMLFVGTVNGTGVIQSHNSNVITSGVTDGTTNISALTNYSAGWTFKVTTAGTITGIGKVEAGDMLICTTNYATAYKAADWDVIQANIDGAVTIASNLTANALVLGASATTVKSLANGTSGQYLIINSSGIPTWTSVASNMRAIKYNGTDFLASNVATALDIVAGTGISVSGNASTGAITISNTGVRDTYALTINNGSTALGSYQPKTAAATLKFDGGLKATLSGTTFSVEHSSSSPTKTTGLYKFSVDAYGHVTAGDAVTSLANPNNLIFVNSAGNDISTYNGSAVHRVRFNGGTDIAVATTTASGVTTITPTITHRYRAISFQDRGASAATAVFSNSAAGTVTFKAGNNMNITNASGVLTFTATDTNTWRNVKAIIAGQTAVTEVLSTSIGVADLEFGSDFLWTEVGNNGKLQIGWAEINADGKVTYVI